MSENIENPSSLYEKQILNQEFGLCSDCNQPNTDYKWCQNCNSKIFQQEFIKWTSGNKHIDKFIQDAQLKARNKYEVIEWIPHNRLRNIQYLAKGGFSTIYKAIWLDGWIYSLSSENKRFERKIDSLENEDYENAKNKNIRSSLKEDEKRGNHVLESLNNSSNINEDFLNEVIIHYNNMYNCNLFICKYK